MSKLAKSLGTNYQPQKNHQLSTALPVESEKAALACVCQSTEQVNAQHPLDSINTMTSLNAPNHSQISPLVREQTSPHSIELVKSLSVNDFSVYSTKGVKRDYFKYSLSNDEQESETKLNNAHKKIDQYYLTKVWRIRNNSDESLKWLTITPYPMLENDYDELELAVYKQTKIPTLAPGAEVDIQVLIRMPQQSGLYKRKFRINDRHGGRISLSNNDSNMLEVIFNVVPDKINSPVLGNIVVGDPIKGRDAAGYPQSKTYYFCNWGVYYFDRFGELKKGKSTEVKSHQKYDRFAWDINGKSNFEKDKNVYAIAEGKVVRISKDYGAIWIQHDFIEGQEENTGYIAAYIHMNQSSWSNNSHSKDVWTIGAAIKKHQVLGTISGRYKGSETGVPTHLHFSIAPIKHLDNTKVSQLNTVHANIKELTEDMLAGKDFSKFTLVITKDLPNTGEIPIQDATVTITNTEHHKSSDDRGMVLFERLVDNSFWVNVQHPDFEEKNQFVEFVDNACQSIVIKLTPKASWDISQIPDIMDKNNWHTAASLMRHWFENKPPLSPIKKQKISNDSIVTMKWLLQFKDAKEMYNELVEPSLYQQSHSKNELVKQLKAKNMFNKQTTRFGDLSKGAEFLENNYYIQSKSMGSWESSTREYHIDGLLAALGAFNLHSAVEGTIEYNPEDKPNSNNYKITITKLGIYVKDSYDFVDWQLLGEWDPKTNQAKKLTLESDYHEVTNADFRHWRELNDFGRDFIIYSNVKVVTLKEPVSWIERVVH